MALKLHVSEIGEEYVKRLLISYHSDRNGSFSYALNISLNIKILKN